MRTGFELCDINSLAEIDPVDDPTECIDILLNAGTSVFEIVTNDDDEEMLEEVGPDAIEENDAAVIYGYVVPDAETFTIDAEIVALGDRGTYTIVECEAEGPATGNDVPTFPCETADTTDGENPDDVVITIALIEGSKLFERDGTPAELVEIQDGVDIESEGDLVASQEEGVLDRLDAFIAFVDDDPEDHVEGILDAIHRAERRLAVVDEDDVNTQHCVLYDEDTVFYEVVDDSEGSVADADDLNLGDEIEASGFYFNSCLEATTIVFEES